MISTILDWVRSILGEYEPITYTAKLLVPDVLNGGSESVSYTAIPSGLSGVNWEYVVTAALLLVVIYSVFRLLGVLLQSLCGGRRC